jgi:hypothetical protein
MRIFKDLSQSDLEESHEFFRALVKWLDDYSDFSDDNESLIGAINVMHKQYEASESVLLGEILQREQDAEEE